MLIHCRATECLDSLLGVCLESRPAATGFDDGTICRMPPDNVRIVFVLSLKRSKLVLVLSGPQEPGSLVTVDVTPSAWRLDRRCGSHHCVAALVSLSEVPDCKVFSNCMALFLSLRQAARLAEAFDDVRLSA